MEQIRRATWEELSARRRKFIPLPGMEPVEGEGIPHIEIGSVSAREQREIRELCVTTRKARNMKRTQVADELGNQVEPGAYYEVKSLDTELYVRLMAVMGITSPEVPGETLRDKSENLEKALGFQCLTGIFNEIWKLSSLDPKRVEEIMGS